MPRSQIKRQDFNETMIVAIDNYLNFYIPYSNKKTRFGRNFIMFSAAKLEMPVLNVKEHRQKQAILSSFFA